MEINNVEIWRTDSDGYNRHILLSSVYGMKSKMWNEGKETRRSCVTKYAYCHVVTHKL